MRKINLFIKRIIDIVVSLISIIILLPVFIVIALIIKITSKGPVLFKQDRIGKNGEVFKIIKFRTMVVNAENLGDGLSVKSENDSRITKVGRFLRATSIDELPQLINVLIGQMSLVGPRPPATYHPYNGYESYPEWGKTRFEMRPGITGLAQVKVRNSVSWEERIKIDNAYIENFNIWLDIKIIIMTIIKLLKKENIYFGDKVYITENGSDKNYKRG